MSDLYEAVDKWDRKLVEGDTVITQGRLAQFSHCTAKRIMVRIPCAWSGHNNEYNGFKLVQRQRNDIQKFVPELEDDFLQKMAEAKFKSAELKKQRAAEMEEMKENTL